MRTKTSRGYDSILVCNSIASVKQYYDTLRRMIKQDHRDLKVAIIFTYAVNGENFDSEQGFMDVEALNTDAMAPTSASSSPTRPVRSCTTSSSSDRGGPMTLQSTPSCGP